MPTTDPDFMQNDTGLKVKVAYVLLDGTARDVSAATTQEIEIQKPSESTFTAKPSVFETDGQDGLTEYAWQSGDLDEVGHYQARGHIIEPGKDYRTDIFEFVVGD